MSVTKTAPIALPAVLALGSNLGDREAAIRSAVAEIDAVDGVTVTAASRLYESAALKVTGVDAAAPAYLNAVVTVTSSLLPNELLSRLSEIEHRHGRVRAERWDDRTLDIDIVTYAGISVDSDDLRLPHPRAVDRAFVLVPWLELEPAAILPGSGRVDELVQNLSDSVQPYSAEPLR